MAALETFVFQFETKGSKMVLTDIQQISEKTRKLESLIQKDTKATDLNTASMKKNTDALKKHNSELWTYMKRLVGVYAIYKLVRKGIGLGLNFIEQGNNLRNISTTANVSTDTLQRWGYAAAKYGGNEASVAAQMGSLNSKLYAAKNFGDYSAFENLMTKYGITPTTTNAEEFLKDIANKITGLDRQRQLDILNSAGITDDSMQRLLMSGNLQEQLDKAKIVYTNEDIERAAQAKEKMVQFNKQLERLAVIIGGMTLDPLIDTVKELADFLADPKKYMTKGNGKKAKEAAIDGIWQLVNPQRYWNLMTGGKAAGKKDGSYVDAMQNWFNAMNQATAAMNTGVMNNVLNKGDVSLSNENNVTINGVDTSELANKTVGAVMDVNQRSFWQLQVLLANLALQMGIGENGE